MSDANPQLRPKSTLITDAGGVFTANVTPAGQLEVTASAGSSSVMITGPGGTNTAIVTAAGALDVAVIPPVVQNVLVTTAALANNASAEVTVQIPGPFQLLWITVSAFCRVRLYSTAAVQAADLSRPSTQTPTPATATGIISDAVLTTSLALGYLGTFGENGDAPATNTIYTTVTNLSGSLTTISINVAYTNTLSM